MLLDIYSEREEGRREVSHTPRLSPRSVEMSSPRQAGAGGPESFSSAHNLTGFGDPWGLLPWGGEAFWVLTWLCI